jgi:hypothetical protein
VSLLTRRTLALLTHSSYFGGELLATPGRYLVRNRSGLWIVWRVRVIRRLKRVSYTQVAILLIESIVKPAGWFELSELEVEIIDIE